MGGKQGDMQSAMMQQMMKQAMKQAGSGAPPPGGMPGFPPSPGAGGMPGFPPMPPPPGAAGFPPFPGAPAATPTPAAGAAAAAASASPAFDVSATEVKKEGEQKKEAAPAAPAAAAEASKMGSGSFFSDATDDAGPSTATPPPNPFADASSGAVEGEPVDADAEEAELKYMQDMLRNPQMQEMMYPYLPEMMRNPETFEMLLTNPMYKDQLKGIMAQMKTGGGGVGGMPDVNSPEVQEQFAAMGMTPQDAIQKLMQDPELAMAFQDPKVQAAVMDCSSNPNNIMKYQGDPQIMNVFTKLAAMFPGATGAAP